MYSIYAIIHHACVVMVALMASCVVWGAASAASPMLAEPDEDQAITTTGRDRRPHLWDSYVLSVFFQSFKLNSVRQVSHAEDHLLACVPYTSHARR
jgi:ABC-type Fe3+ transport system permease subunit